MDYTRESCLVCWSGFNDCPSGWHNYRNVSMSKSRRYLTAYVENTKQQTEDVCLMMEQISADVRNLTYAVNDLTELLEGKLTNE